MAGKENSIGWISNLRVIATIAVIVVHVSMESRFDASLYSDLIYGGLARFCVPIFIMITGALLIPKDLSLDIFTKKWIIKIIPPFLFWNIPYLIYNAQLRPHTGDVFSFKSSLYENFKSLFQDGVSYHFWYVYMIVGVYLFLPIIGKWARNATNNELLYFLLIWFGLMVVQIPSLSKYKPAIDLYYFSGYIGYLILGYFLYKQDRHNKIWVPLLLIVFGHFLTSALTYYFTVRDNHFVHTYYDYLRPNVVVLSAGVFLLFKQLNKGVIQNSFARNIWHLLEKHSYGIYLCHLLVLIMLKNYGFDNRFIHPLIGTPLCTLFILILSFLLVWVINKVPFIGKYISG